jgi:hypothetical protein
MNLDGSNLIALTGPVQTYFPISFSPDGRKIALSCGENVCVMNADGSKMIALTTGRAPVFVP